MPGCVAGTIAGVIAAVVAGTALARPLTPAEKRYHPYYADLPRCDAPKVRDFIQSRFEQRESYYWKSGLEIEAIQGVRETAFRRTGIDYIPRRYCEANAVMNDRKTRKVIYWIGEELDMTGPDSLRSLSQSLTFGFFPRLDPGVSEVHWGVEWCVVGLDRNYAHGRNCSAARP